MRIESIAVGRPRIVPWQGRDVPTSIFKATVAGPVRLVPDNLEGDRQADPRVHGGEYKAVYAYAAEHYDWWKSALGRELEAANFGENLTVRDFDEAAVSIGDVFRVGDAELEATAPRLPCFKLGLRFGDPHMVQRFTDAKRWGIYFRVAREGTLAAGDAMELVHSDRAGVPVYDIARVFVFDGDDVETIGRLARHERLDPSWRSHFAGKLASHSGRAGAER